MQATNSHNFGHIPTTLDIFPQLRTCFRSVSQIGLIIFSNITAKVDGKSTFEKHVTSACWRCLTRLASLSTVEVFLLCVVAKKELARLVSETSNDQYRYFERADLGVLALLDKARLAPPLRVAQPLPGFGDCG